MKSKRLIAALLAVMILALAFVGCKAKSDTSDSGSGSSDSKTESKVSGSLNIEGSDTMVNLSNAWGEEFQKENPEVMLSIKGGGSGVGIASLINGTVDFANASRQMKDEEKTEAEKNGGKVVENEVAKDGIAVIVNPANKVEDLTEDQIGKIYRGEITNWKDVGGADKKIVLLSRDSSSGTFEFFSEKVVGKDKKMAKDAQLLASNQAIVDEVSKNDAAIGYCGIGYVKDTIKAIKVNGIEVSVDNVLNETYPLSRGLYMYASKANTDAMQAFLDFTESPAGQKIVEDQGFVPLSK